MAAWVFQGNPEKFDLDDYLARYPELIYWRTPRYAKNIAVGDDAFIWRSGINAGAVAWGEVVEAPTPGNQVTHPEALGIDLWRAEPPDLKELKTGILLRDIRLSQEDGFVPRSVAKQNSEMADAMIITMPNGSVFPLTAPQAAALKGLFGASISDHIPVEVGTYEGGKVLRSHYLRERSSLLRNKKIAQIREEHGQCSCSLCGISEDSSYPKLFSNRVFEVHHKSPLSKASTPVRTTLDDLTVLCANCHRAVHSSAAVEQNYDALVMHFRGGVLPRNTR